MDWDLFTGPKADYVRKAVTEANEANIREMNTTYGKPNLREHKRRVQEAREKAIAEWDAKHPNGS